MSTLRPTSAKILQHSTGMGAPHIDLVRQRARELARIDGRAQFNDEDWRLAKRELHGGHEFTEPTHGSELTALVSEHDMVATDAGHQVERMQLDDESIGEELIAEGMDEAVHEQMLAARLEEPSEEDE